MVIPKAMRQILGLEPGGQVSIEAREGRIELTAAPLDVDLQVRGSLLVAVPRGGPMPSLTAEEVRDVLDRVRR